MNRLEQYGWNAFFQEAFDIKQRDGLQPARVIEEQRGLWRVLMESGTPWAYPSGKFRHESGGLDRPAVGDWVLVEQPDNSDRVLVQDLLPRAGVLVRRAAKRSVEAQVVAANLDTVFLVVSLNRDFNPRRIERYLTMICDAGAEPVLLLNKIDLCDDLNRLVEAKAVAAGLPIHPISALYERGLDVVQPYLIPGITVAVIGSSGVGKSTLINRLVGDDVQLVREIRESDDRGRHTTTNRQIVEIPGGGVLMDTPGMRELGLWDSPAGLKGAFGEIEALMDACRFRDCRHESEPGCAVREALEDGTLAPDRYESYGKMQREMEFVARKQNQKLKVEAKQKWKKQTKAWHKQARSDPRIRKKRGG